MRTKEKFTAIAIALFTQTSLTGLADVLVSDVYSQAPYTTGDLAGQSGWSILFGAAGPSGVSIASGAATITGGTTTNLPDIGKTFAPILSLDGASIYYSTTITITQATPFTANFFLGLQTTDNFNNVSLNVQGSTATTFQFGIRPTGQGANSVVFGSDLSYGVAYNIVVGYDWLNGASNDLVSLWVNPVSGVRSENTAYATNINLGSDMLGVQGVRFLPFGSPTSPSPGVALDNLFVTYSADSVTGFSEAVAAVPEPSTVLLMCVAGFAVLIYRRKLRA